jgi:hypothetical protein
MMGFASLYPSCKTTRLCILAVRSTRSFASTLSLQKTRATVLEVDRRTAGLKAGAERATAFGG